MADHLQHERMLGALSLPGLAGRRAAVQAPADTTPAREASLWQAVLRAARDWTAAAAQLHLTGRYLDGTGSGWAGGAR